MRKAYDRFMKNIRLFLGNFITNLKSRLKGDSKILRKMHNDSWQSAHCKEYDIQGYVSKR